jgi:hypothetical protein
LGRAGSADIRPEKNEPESGWPGVLLFTQYHEPKKYVTMIAGPFSD